MDSVKISESRRLLIQTFANEFKNTYLMEPKGQKHLALYNKEREQVKKYWADIKEKKEKGKEYYKDVLEKLLPYQDTRNNRERGVRISVMPAITKDLMMWFEGANWQTRENWPKVGHAIFDLYYEIIENENYSAFKKFEDNTEVSKGIKSGFLSPTLFFLNSKYRVLNNKTVLTINFILERRAIGRELTSYMDNVSVINAVVKDLQIDFFNEPEKFDMFCHFMCDKRLGGYAKYIDKINVDPEIDIEEEGEIKILDGEFAPTGHWEAIYYITQIGKKLGYKT